MTEHVTAPPLEEAPAAQDKTTAMQARMQLLRIKYLQQMSDRIAAISGIAERVREGCLNDADHADLIVHGHKLAGSGGLYGFMDITQTARAMEVSLKADPQMAARVAQPLVQAVMDACKAACETSGVAVPQGGGGGGAPPAGGAPAPVAAAAPEAQGGTAVPTPSVGQESVRAQAPPDGPDALAAALPSTPPAAVAAEVATEKSVHREAPSRLTPRKPTLLVVDDDESVVDVLISMFVDHANVIASNHPEHAFKQMLSHQPDLVLLDDNLLGAATHDGLRLIESMRAHVQLKNIPVIMLTGNAHPSEVLRGLAAGAADYVVKPFSTDELGQKVLSRLRRLGITVVIADDDVFLSDVLAERFRSLGYRIQTCADGAHLVEYLQWHHAALVVMEWMLPRIDGMTVLRMMQSDERLRSIPVVVTSTRRRGDDFAEAFDAGAADYLVKPMKMEEAVARVQRLLPHRREA